MTFGEVLLQSRDAVVKRWCEIALSAYPEEASVAFQRQKDPFANPVGHSLRTGTRVIFEALLDGTDDAKIRRHLQEIISIRAVQELPASRAVGFVFELKEAIRAEMGESAADPRFASELARFNGQIDRIALVAFDVYVQCRERVCELRINEVKRQVSWVVGKMNAGNSKQIDGNVAPPEKANAQTEGIQ